MHVWNFLFNGISERRDFYKRKASEELSNKGGMVGTCKATKEARLLGRANLSSFHSFLMLIPKEGLVSMKVCPSPSPPPNSFFWVGLMGRDFLSLPALSLSSLTLTGSCTSVLKTVPWWTVMHKGFALSNETKPASPAWYVPTCKCA